MNVTKVLNSIKNTSRVVHGINPVFVVQKTGKIVELPRFSSPEMSIAREMNKISSYGTYKKVSNSLPSKASAGDLERLISQETDASYNRAVWVNPKDRRAYYLLKEDESKDGIVLRVLKENGEFKDNITVQPKRIMLGDLVEGDNCITQIFGVDFNHSDLMETIAKRYNPFAKFDVVKLRDDYDLLELADNISPDTSYLELSYIIESKINPKAKGSQIEHEVIEQLRKNFPAELDYLNQLQNLSSKVRVLMSSGNDGADTLNSLLINTGFEGVGGLNNIGKVDRFSGSKSSYFTQHYEPFNFNITTTPYGINLTGLRGTDIGIEHDKPVNKFLYNLRGTSFSAPVRVAKLALNDMLCEKI